MKLNEYEYDSLHHRLIEKIGEAIDDMFDSDAHLRASDAAILALIPAFETPAWIHDMLVSAGYKQTLNDTIYEKQVASITINAWHHANAILLTAEASGITLQASVRTTSDILKTERIMAFAAMYTASRFSD